MTQSIEEMKAELRQLKNTIELVLECDDDQLKQGIIKYYGNDEKEYRNTIDEVSNLDFVLHLYNNHCKIS